MCVAKFTNRMFNTHSQLHRIPLPNIYLTFRNNTEDNLLTYCDFFTFRYLNLKYQQWTQWPVSWFKCSSKIPTSNVFVNHPWCTKTEWKCLKLANPVEISINLNKIFLQCKTMTAENKYFSYLSSFPPFNTSPKINVVIIYCFHSQINCASLTSFSDEKFKISTEFYLDGVLTFK